MADLEARREARNRKILQNREKRMNILYGRKETDTDNDLTSTKTNITNDSEASEPVQDINASNDITVIKHNRRNEDTNSPDVPSNKTGESDLGTQILSNKVKVGVEENTSTSSFMQDSDRLHSPQSDTDGVRHRATRNTVKIQQSSQPSDKEYSKGPSSEEASKPTSKRSPLQQLNLLRLAGCVFIAILSRVVLQLGIGLFYFQTIVLPFTVLQAALYYYRISFVKDIPHKGTALSSALMLCGLKPELIVTYNKIMGNVAAVYEDFSFYLFAFFCSNMLLTQEAS